MTRADRDLPDHAYVPGQTPRHAEGRFAPICATARQHMSPAQLAQSEAFCTGLYYFRSGYFWEAHELFEPVWMALEEGSDDRRFLQALIQLANAQLKIKMQRPKAAKRLCNDGARIDWQPWPRRGSWAIRTLSRFVRMLGGCGGSSC